MRPALTTLLLLSCTKPAAPEAAPTQTVVDPPASEVAPAEHMRDHHDRITRARDAIIRGDLEAAREPMDWLGQHDTHPGVPEEARPYILEMKGAARVAAGASTIDGVAVGLATVATICGECHARLDLGPRFEPVEMPPAEAGVAWHMARHRWAADRMWEGMIAASDDLWVAGVGGLKEDPLREEELHGGEMSEDERAVATWLHDMATFGEQMEGSMARSAFYGALLSKCSDCHTRAGGGPE